MVIWQYNPETSTATLVRNYRIARWIVHTCFFCAVAGISSLAQSLMFGFSTVALVIMASCWGVTSLLILPAILMLPWMSDTEKELVKRRERIPGGLSLDRRSQQYALKMMFWFGVAVFGPVLLRFITQS